MLSSFYLFIVPLLGVGFYVCFKFILHNAELKKISAGQITVDGRINNLDEAKGVLFDFIFEVKENLQQFLTVFFHWFLHFFVLFLKFVSNLADFLYVHSRDFFLQTATKEKNAVSTFWHHLKEYKKEKEEEKK